MAEGDVVAVLTRDHDKVEELFRNYDQTSSTTAKKQLAVDIILELLRHSAAEEKIVYPTARKIIPNGDEVIEKEIAQQAAARRTMTALRATKPTDPDFDRLVHELLAMVSEHVWEQEEVWFPQLRQRMPADGLRELAEQVEAMHAASRVQPTAPPAPQPSPQPPGRLLLGAGITIVNRARHLLTALARVLNAVAGFVRRPAVGTCAA